jgi:erythromycin esterase-like protein/predicted phosphoribosyltransferase
MAFADRVEAGRALAGALQSYAGRRDTVVLALPRGGVPVAAQVAAALGAPLDVFVVRKLGVPGHEELAMGALASGGIRVLNHEVVEILALSPAVIDRVAEREQRELDRRERAYRHGRPPLDVAGKTVILVDDGLATGSTMRAAIAALRTRQPAAIVVAVPVAAADTCRQMADISDDVICAITPQPFVGVGLWYRDFSQTSDEEVQWFLDQADRRTREGQPAAAALEPDRRPPSAGALVAALRRHVIALDGDLAHQDRLLADLGERRVVLIGEASHGTHEFYRERARLTSRLITDHGFTAVAVEADWPDAYRVNRFVRNQTDDATAAEALGGFVRFPAWMWRNADVLDFVGWLREHNDELPAGAARVGFYGIDLYSLRASIQAVVSYLETVDPAAAERARQRYACFDHPEDDGQRYGFAASLDIDRRCEDQAVAQLVDMRRQAAERAGAAPLAEDEQFYAEQNALVVRNAEAYYRSMFGSRVSSWNLRDRHMMEMLEALVGHLDGRGRPSPTKLVVWAHNSHLGDARATDMGAAGELNLGQLVRERFGRDATALVGFSTHEGTVTAASSWGAPAQRKTVRPSLPGSYEALFHATGLARFLLPLDARHPAIEALRQPRLQRAIGVIYLPESERQSHYFHARLPDQFDWMIHIDHTRAVDPLERTSLWDRTEAPETFPTAV